MLDYTSIYADIAQRTGGDIYLGVVGPVRTGKSTFIKRFMELMVLPMIQDEALSQRARDELPQSAAGRTIMTTEPKFIPEKAIEVTLDSGVAFRTRLVDCVGYVVPGAVGNEENEKPRMVKSPWFTEEVPFAVAAKTGTQKVMKEHATIGIVVTTDGSVSGLPRHAYEEAEAQVIGELQALKKPFVIILNCEEPMSEAALSLAKSLSEKYRQTVLPVNCARMSKETVAGILKFVLFAFPVREIAVAMPSWIPLLDAEHPLRRKLYDAIAAMAQSCRTMQDIATLNADKLACDACEQAIPARIEPGTGRTKIALTLQPNLFYQVLSEMTGLPVSDETSLMPCVIAMAQIKKRYEQISSALEEVQATGYGIVMPSKDQLALEEPEIVHQGGRYGVRLRASAPSIHMMRATITTEVAPIVGSEKQSEALVKNLLNDFEEDPLKIWESNIFGKSLHELVSEGLQNKLINMPCEARLRIQETMERIINEGCNGLICIIL